MKMFDFRWYVWGVVVGGGGKKIKSRSRRV